MSVVRRNWKSIRQTTTLLQDYRIHFWIHFAIFCSSIWRLFRCYFLPSRYTWYRCFVSSTLWQHINIVFYHFRFNAPLFRFLTLFSMHSIYTYHFPLCPRIEFLHFCSVIFFGTLLIFFELNSSTINWCLRKQQSTRELLLGERCFHQKNRISYQSHNRYERILADYCHFILQCIFIQVDWNLPSTYRLSANEMKYFKNKPIEY